MKYRVCNIFGLNGSDARYTTYLGTITIENTVSGWLIGLNLARKNHPEFNEVWIKSGL